MSTIVEKFISYGVESLSDAELISLVIGEKSDNCVRELMNKYDGLKHLERAGYLELAYDDLFGMKEDQAIRFEASLELGRRMERARLGNRVQVTSPEDAVVYMGPKLRGLDHEVFYMMFLNNAKFVTGTHKISSGGSTATIVDPAEVMRQAILRKAESIVLFHNHPSGNNKASRADIQLTKRIDESGKLLGIRVDDHIIIAGDGFTSFRSKGLL